ncbi:MAG TPA: 16S rRNA (cytidine(1402)-2'-O)-methyltransferase [Vicinamibacterales bacterium]
MPGTLFLVATPIGNLEDITLRALRVLREVDLIAAEDTRRTAKLLTHYGIATPTVSLHAHNERRRVPQLLEEVAAGRSVAVVTDAGMPGVSDPGYLIVSEAVRRGDIRIEVLPGASALTAALAGSGLPTDTVTFLGFSPARTAERRRWLAQRAARAQGTLVLYESPLRLAATLEDLTSALGDRGAVVARELTKVHESWHRGRLSELATAARDGRIPQRGECVILVSGLEDALVDGERPQLSESEALIEFGRLTEELGLSKRDALHALAAETRLSRRELYSLIERAKSSGK